MTTMEGFDAMLRETQQVQEHAVEELREAESFPITGVQVNDASRMVTIYQRQTGQPSVLPKLAAEMALRKRYRDPRSPLFKQFIFAAKPTKEYHPGETKCLLHPTDPRRSTFDEWGLPVCDSAHLHSLGEMRRHMEKRHPSADKVIKEDEAGRRRQEDLEAQHALGASVLEAIQRLAVPVGASVTAPEPRPTIRRRGPNRRK